MRVLVVGGDGMLGHQLMISLADRHDVRATLRRGVDGYPGQLFSPANSFGDVDVTRFAGLEKVVAAFRPEAVLNCIGVLKHPKDSGMELTSIEVNAAFPHRLLALCRRHGGRLIHISTDCVFSGRTGGYRESDPPDPSDLYGRTKLLGEVTAAPGLTLRTSIVGLELSRFTGLVEWFLGRDEAVVGYRRAIYSGVTTAELARVIDRLLTQHPSMSGLWHLSSTAISKHELLTRLAARTGRPAPVANDDTVVCDRSLRSDAFTQATGYVAPSWDVMLDELAGSIRRRAGAAQASA